MFLDHFNSRAAPNPEDPEGLVLTADEPKKVKIFLSGDHIDEWIVAFNNTLSKMKVRPCFFCCLSAIPFLTHFLFRVIETFFD